MFSTINHKLGLTISLLADIFRRLFDRIRRWGWHMLKLPFYLRSSKLHGIKLSPAGRFFLWLGECFLLVTDILGLPECYEIANCWAKFNARPLNGEERQLVTFIFGNELPVYRILLDEKARMGPKQYRFCYVSFCVINSWRAMPPAILVHELVHVWQFQRYGSPYLLRALLAQRTSMGYDYGGFPALAAARRQGLDLQAFNYEQQASIVEDYFRLYRGGRGRWNPEAAKNQLLTYEYFTASLRKH